MCVCLCVLVYVCVCVCLYPVYNYICVKCVCCDLCASRLTFVSQVLQCRIREPFEQHVLSWPYYAIPSCDGTQPRASTLPTRHWLCRCRVCPPHTHTLSFTHVLTSVFPLSLSVSLCDTQTRRQPSRAQRHSLCLLSRCHVTHTHIYAHACTLSLCLYFSLSVCVFSLSFSHSVCVSNSTAFMMSLQEDCLGHGARIHASVSEGLGESQ